MRDEINDQFAANHFCLKVTALDGTAPKRVVIIAWNTMGQIQAWRADPQFKPTRQIVDKYSNFRVYAVEGFR